MQEFAKGAVLKKGVLKMSNEKFCACCGSISEKMYKVNNKFYCSNCMGLCSECGSLEFYDDMILINVNTSGEGYVCTHCLKNDNIFYCNHCELYYSENYLWGYYQEHNICDHCSENYSVCDICAAILPNDDMMYLERTNENLCPDCYEENSYNLCDIIESYSYKPSPQFYGNNSDHCYLGIELEVDNTANDYDNKKIYMAAKHIIEKYGDRAYIKADSSLQRGFEITTHPASLWYHINAFGWKDIMNICKSGTLRGEDCSTAGLHIHLSRSYFGDSREIQDLHIAKLMLLISKFYTSHILKFSRRKPEELRWCGNPEMGFDFLDDEKTIVDKLKQCKAKGRYLALNLENEHTIEFRVFKSSLNLCTFLASLQFVVEISKYAKETDLVDIQTTNWRDIFMSTEYPELKSYLERKELI